MANNLSNYLENKLLDHSVGKASFTMPTAYIALYTVAPTDSGGGTEVTGGSYARVATSGSTWNSAASGSISNAAEISFPTATADQGTVVAMGILDASSAGNLLWYGTLTVSKVIGDGDTFKFAAGALVLTLD